MNTHLFTTIISVALALFNLYSFIQSRSGTSFILFIIWLVIALRYFKQFKANKDKNSENNP